MLYMISSTKLRKLYHTSYITYDLLCHVYSYNMSLRTTIVQQSGYFALDVVDTSVGASSFFILECRRRIQHALFHIE